LIIYRNPCPIHRLYMSKSLSILSTKLFKKINSLPALVINHAFILITVKVTISFPYQNVKFYKVPFLNVNFFTGSFSITSTTTWVLTCQRRWKQQWVSKQRILMMLLLAVLRDQSPFATTTVARAIFHLSGLDTID
jgi:hypothetical protein